MRAKKLAVSKFTRGFLVFMAIAMAGLGGLSQLAQALPGDYAWQKAGTQGITGDRAYWSSIASSADGTKLAAVGEESGSIYTSTDSGVTWTEQTGAGERDWRSIASSADGTKLAAAVYDGPIYTSTDSGSTWTQQTDAGSRGWQSIASSADGTKLAAVVWGGSIYLATTEGPATITQPLATIPDGNKAPAGIKSAVANSILSITSSTCYSLNTPSVRTLGSSTVTAPSGIDILGGVAFTISCVSNGGSSSVRVALAEQLADISSLRIYKALSDGSNLTDITHQVSISNQDNKTVINYNLIDGGELDEDGLANGTIVDPLYIGVSAESADGDTTGSNGALADTGQGTFALLAGASLLIISGLAVLLGRKKLLGQ